MSNIQDDSEDTQKEPTAESVAAESGEEGSSENQSVLIPVETGEDGA